MIKCGITGHSGNLGKTFIRKIKNFKFLKFKGDIRNKNQIDKWIKNNEFDLIVHFAAIAPVNLVNKNYNKALKVNYHGTKNLINSICKNNKKIKWFFFSSTSHVYPFSNNKLEENNRKLPISKYGKTKLLAEKFILKKLKSNGINCCIGRIFSIVDNKNKSFLINKLAKRLINSRKSILLKNFNHIRDFVTTEQVSLAIYNLWKIRCSEAVNIANGKKIHLKNIALLYSKKLKKNIVFKDNKITMLVANVKKMKKYGIRPKNINFKKYLYKT